MLTPRYRMRPYVMRVTALIAAFLVAGSTVRGQSITQDRIEPDGFRAITIATEQGKTEIRVEGSSTIGMDCRLFDESSRLIEQIAGSGRCLFSVDNQGRTLTVRVRGFIQQVPVSVFVNGRLITGGQNVKDATAKMPPPLPQPAKDQPPPP